MPIRYMQVDASVCPTALHPMWELNHHEALLGFNPNVHMRMAACCSMFASCKVPIYEQTSITASAAPTHLTPLGVCHACDVSLPCQGW